MPETGLTADQRIELIKRGTARLTRALVIMLAVLAVVIVASFSLNHVSAAYVVIPTGVIGGFVGLQRRLKTLPDQDLRLIAESWVYTVLSPLVGGVLALLLFVLFLSGLLEGDLFPSFAPEAGAEQDRFTVLFAMRGETPQDYAKLFFWAFLAGFSERFMVDILGRFERSGAGA